MVWMTWVRPGFDGEAVQVGVVVVRTAVTASGLVLPVPCWGRGRCRWGEAAIGMVFPEHEQDQRRGCEESPLQAGAYQVHCIDLSSPRMKAHRDP